MVQPRKPSLPWRGSCQVRRRAGRRYQAVIIVIDTFAFLRHRICISLSDRERKEMQLSIIDREGSVISH
jgi:hypothetical protein